MQISARNQLKAVMSEVVVDVGGQQMVAIIKSTDVMIGK